MQQINRVLVGLVGVCQILAWPAICRAPYAGQFPDANCHKSVSALAPQFAGLAAAASALGFPSVNALQLAIVDEHALVLAARLLSFNLPGTQGIRLTVKLKESESCAVREVARRTGAMVEGVQQ